MRVIPEASDQCSCGVAHRDRRGQAYNEEAFHYFLALERRRSERSGRSLLLLVDLVDRPGADGRFDPQVASKLFSELWRCLRETDFAGWYRNERVAGVVMTEFGVVSDADAAHSVGRRIGGRLRERLPSHVARRLRVRVYRNPDPTTIDSGAGVYAVF